jgi:hypothetical protein
VASGSLPHGLTLDAATGTITGTIAPGAAGWWGTKKHTITIKATNGTSSDSDTFVWTVRRLPKGHYAGDRCGRHHHFDDHDNDDDDGHHHDWDRHQNHDGDEDHRECLEEGGPRIVKPEDRSDYNGSTVVLRVRGSDPRNHRVWLSADNLPPGLIMDPDGRIAGRIDAAAKGRTYTVTVTGTDGQIPCTQSFTWKIK